MNAVAVAVVGAGPVGMTMALSLARYGVPSVLAILLSVIGIRVTNTSHSSGTPAIWRIVTNAMLPARMSSLTSRLGYARNPLLLPVK